MPEENVSRNTIKNIVIGVVIALISSVGGYYVNEFLTRERVSVAHIGIKPKTVAIAASNEFKQKVNRLTNTLYIHTVFDIESQTHYSADHIKGILENLSTELFNLNEGNAVYSTELDQIKSMQNGVINPDGFYKIGSKYLDSFNVDNRSDLGVIQGNIEMQRASNEERIIKVTEAIMVIVNEALNSNTEKEFQINVIVLNSGKTQALVRNSGYLKFDEDIVYLKNNDVDTDVAYIKFLRPAMLSNGDFIIVRENAFDSLNLVVDKYNNRQRMLDLVKREYLNSSRIATLVLTDAQGNEISSEPFIFRNDLEEDRKIGLSEFLENNYRLYIDPNYSSRN
ncbi:hypothetical protein [Aliivibrio sp. EL58]|uniref:hypothetical protein n=1 Tax=Aliivibrio sp. EL58 TaxID=2107582 RepID=UPI000EFBF4EC|nr:hypothetical protein [Aliivibrio sp. EL58]